MSETTKTRAGAATPTRAVETGTPAKMATTSTTKYTPSAAGRQPFRVADLLLPGAENAIPRRDLMALTGCSDRERRQGCPILSDNVHGYFLPGDKSERDRCVRSLRRRAGEIMETAASIEQAEV